MRDLPAPPDENSCLSQAYGGVEAGPGARCGLGSIGGRGACSNSEVVGEFARDFFADVRSLVRAAVGQRVQPLTFQEVVLDELR